MHITTDFEADDGLFVEENGLHNRVIENSTLTLKSDDPSGHLAYIHVYEANVAMKARFMYTKSAPSNAYLSFVLRYSSPHAYVRVSYYHKSKSWALMQSEGKDFLLFRVAENLNAAINPDEWHDIEFSLDHKTANVYLDGKLIIETDAIEHVTPGRIAVCATKMTLKVDSFDAALLSGHGTVWQNCIHNRLPDEDYREGGTVLEMKDKTLKYIHKSGATFDSHDNGVTWEMVGTWTDTNGYPNILRLANGDFIKIVGRKLGDARYVACRLSSDDGATWRDGGEICLNPYKGNTSAVAVNTNDNVTQISTGRIFYSQNYESMPWGTEVDGRTVFCEFFYSDDNGMTWHEAKSRSWDISGDIIRFGECKALESADGTHRIYNSWNQLGVMTYSESFDGGDTWSPMTLMNDYKCPSSSMQFCRDEYAENKTTYYMVWVNSEERAPKMIMPRSRLSLMCSYDGKEWEFLGDVWRWDPHLVCGCDPCHIVDPFIKVTKDHVIVGSGISERRWIPEAGDNPTHHAQRQHIYSVKKASLTEKPLTSV